MAHCDTRQVHVIANLYCVRHIVSSPHAGNILGALLPYLWLKAEEGVADPYWHLPIHFLPDTMAPMKAMKTMKAPMKASGKAMTKGAMMKDIATEHGLKTKEVSLVFDSLAAIATKEVKKVGVFTVPGLCRIKTRTKPATKAGVRMMFGQETKVKAKPARTVVKAFAVSALKKQI